MSAALPIDPIILTRMRFRLAGDPTQHALVVFPLTKKGDFKLDGLKVRHFGTQISSSNPDDRLWALDLSCGVSQVYAPADGRVLQLQVAGESTWILLEQTCYLGTVQHKLYNLKTPVPVAQGDQVKQGQVLGSSRSGGLRWETRLLFKDEDQEELLLRFNRIQVKHPGNDGLRNKGKWWLENLHEGEAFDLFLSTLERGGGLPPAQERVLKVAEVMEPVQETVKEGVKASVKGLKEAGHVLGETLESSNISSLWPWALAFTMTAAGGMFITWKVMK